MRRPVQFNLDFNDSAGAPCPSSSAPLYPCYQTASSMEEALRTGFKFDIPDDAPHCYIDLTKLPKINAKFVECPSCQGYGHWISILNRWPNQQNYLKRNVRGQDAYLSCSHCNGFGYCDPKYADHIHKLVFVKNTGRCLNLYKCSLCDYTREIDSSG